ncbi:MAG TPA: hypothetical protein VIQ30_04790 [Pseudonocardia sp.]
MTGPTHYPYHHGFPCRGVRCGICELQQIIRAIVPWPLPDDPLSDSHNPYLPRSPWWEPDQLETVPVPARYEFTSADWAAWWRRRAPRDAFGLPIREFSWWFPGRHHWPARASFRLPYSRLQLAYLLWREDRDRLTDQARGRVRGYITLSPTGEPYEFGGQHHDMQFLRAAENDSLRAFQGRHSPALRRRAHRKGGRG